MFLSSISQTRGPRGLSAGNTRPWLPSNSAAVRHQCRISNVAEEASAVARVLAIAHTSAYHPSLLQQRSAVVPSRSFRYRVFSSWTLVSTSHHFQQCDATDARATVQAYRKHLLRLRRSCMFSTQTFSNDL